MEKEEILKRLELLGIKNYKDLMTVINIPKRTVEKWFLPSGNFPSWFIYFLELLEENHKLINDKKILEENLINSLKN
ncbi:XRE family transcriptional regulator [Arcobacter sp. F2176]|uniref:XRE family transcriptional regulator n=1 Tax=Arcobacter sp. F2176 TaxID=2044511 RepID=UPI00100A2574|nr:XRE family transcriptional regulator [Arcobacter sp. F2176]RXJ82153.1 hypothetical protein CRU95_04510 [Arcobacter sp. F2176]